MKFKVTHEVTVEVEIDDAVIKEVTSAEWRKQFYDHRTPEDVAEHLVYNYIANYVENITMLDGFAHLKREQVKFSQKNWELVGVNNK